MQKIVEVADRLLLLIGVVVTRARLLLLVRLASDLAWHALCSDDDEEGHPAATTRRSHLAALLPVLPRRLTRPSSLSKSPSNKFTNICIFCKES